RGGGRRVPAGRGRAGPGGARACVRPGHAGLRRGSREGDGGRDTRGAGAPLALAHGAGRGGAALMPRFSIVMPTRNRAQLLQFALQSALDQPTADLEVVVSDNDSRDDTPAVARRFNDPRVRYVRTPETLAMPDSWEFAHGQRLR